MNIQNFAPCEDNICNTIRFTKTYFLSVLFIFSHSLSNRLHFINYVDMRRGWAQCDAVLQWQPFIKNLSNCKKKSHTTQDQFQKRRGNISNKSDLWIMYRMLYPEFYDYRTKICEHYLETGRRFYMITPMFHLVTWTTCLNVQTYTTAATDWISALLYKHILLQTTWHSTTHIDIINTFTLYVLTHSFSVARVCWQMTPKQPRLDSWLWQYLSHTTYC